MRRGRPLETQRCSPSLRLFRNPPPTPQPPPAQIPALAFRKQENAKTRPVQARICEHGGRVGDVGIIIFVWKSSLKVAAQNYPWICLRRSLASPAVSMQADRDQSAGQKSTL